MTDLIKYREPLTEALHQHVCTYGGCALTPACSCYATADALLASPLLAQIVADAKAEALREAADAWDDPSRESTKHKRDLAWEKYRAGGPSMPAIWLRDRANKIKGAQ